MTESLPTRDPEAQNRRSTRIAQAVPITVSGVDALGQPFKERTTTVMVNCHGCKYQSKHYVPKNSVVTLEVPRGEPGALPRSISGHVVWVQRPRTVRELFQIGMEFEMAGNIWGIAFPPEDWFPCTDLPSDEIDLDVVVETKEPSAEPTSATPPAITPEKQAQIPDEVPPLPSESGSTLASVPLAVPPSPDAKPPASGPSEATIPAGVTGDTKIHVMPLPAVPSQDAQLAIARQMAKMVAEAKETLDKTLRRGAQTAINEEMTIVRQQLDAQMHETVEHAIKASMDRVSETEVKKVVHQAANKTAAIVEEARLASEANVAQIDAKVRQAVQQAVSQAAEQAASQAANKTAAIVEEARLASEANVAQIDAKVRQAVQQAAEQAANKATAITEEARRASEANLQLAEGRVLQAAQEAAKQAVQQAVSQAAEQAANKATAVTEEARRASEANLQLAEGRVLQAAQEAAKQAVRQAFSETLKQSVEQVVGRVIAEREANVPSAEAAQAHFEEWKKNLEQTAQTVRSQMAQQSQAEAETASRLWHEKLEVTLAGSSRELDERLSGASQAALDSTERDLAERKTGLRAVLDEVISGAEASIRSLGAGLAQERANAEQAKAQLEETAKATIEQTRQRMEELGAAQREAIGQRAERVINERIEHIEPLLQSSAEKVMERFSTEFSQGLAPKMEEVQKAVSEISSAAQRAAEAQRELQQQIQQASEQAAHIQDSIESRLRQVSEMALQKALTELANAQQEAARVQDHLHEQARQVAEEVARTKSGALESVQQASHQAVEKAVSDLADARQQTDRLQEALRGQVEQTSGQMALIEQAARERVQRESEATIEKAVGKLAFAGEEVVRLQDSIREQTQRAAGLSEEAGRAARENIQLAAGGVVQRAVAELESAAAQAIQAQESIREQVRQASSQAAEIERKVQEHAQQTVEIQNKLHDQVSQASEQTVRESLERMKQEVAKYPSEFELVCRTTIAKVEDDLDQKSSEMQHAAYEALLKSSEWYQKKAQTSMQSTMERVVEQSSNAMRDKASEVSSIVAAELDHYRRSYVEHGRVEIEETAKEMLDRERLKLNEVAEIATAAFIDRAQHATHESLERFQEASHETLEKARRQMELDRAGSLEEFQRKLDEKMTQGVEQAATYLESQLVPLLESWEAKREAEKREWIERLTKTTEESFESHKARLENATNSWLLASAATLGQNSQAVLDSLSKSAEKRMRDTCSRVLAGMGDELKDRLTGISTGFTEEDYKDVKK